jgi:hypothetical protein
MTGSILCYQQEDSVKLLCKIDLKELFPPTNKLKKERFYKKWNGRETLSISTLRRQVALECKYIKSLPLDHGYGI